MKGERTTAYLRTLIEEKQIPYLDVFVQKEHTALFRRYVSREGMATGKEKLFLYSATKPMTVVGALQLVEQGKLSLDDRVEIYLPAYRDTFLADGTPTKNKMTVRHLFTMSGGLSYRLPNAAAELLKNSDGKASTVEVVSQFAKDPLQFEPGARFEYSFCHDVLAAVVEVVSGKRFAEYMQEKIFQPLGMTNTGFYTETQAKVERMYQAAQSGEIAEIPAKNELILGENYDSGGAGAVATVEDYARFVGAMACGGMSANGYRLRKEETVALLKRETQASLNVNNTFTCVQGSDYGYGLGVRTRTKATDWGLPVGEFGWDGAAGTYMMADPVNRISVTIGMHLRGWPNVFKNEHLKLVQCVYEDLYEEGLL